MATTALSVIILVGIPIVGLTSGPRGEIPWVLLMIVLPLAILCAAMFFIIRGYVVTRDTLFIQRLGWNTKVSLANLRSVEADPEAMSKTIRTGGNGGMFCFAGKFKNKKLGPYRAFVNDPKHAVVLKFTDRTIVVTPDKPAEFVARIREFRNL
jgi:hypothetical protein